MALDIITSVVLTPRGGPAATAIAAVGIGFGIAQGRVIFDPLGQAIDATITLWQDDLVNFTVPAGLAADNEFTRVTIERADLSDSDTIPFWIPDTALTPLGSLPGQLDYQYPAIEEGTSENDDDPLTATAADLNRLIDRLRFVEATGGGAGSGDMTKAVYDTNDDGIVNCADGIDDSGTCRTYAFIESAILTSALVPRLDQFTPGVGQVAFILSFPPNSAPTVEMRVNGVDYAPGVHFNVVGTTLTWLNPFMLDAQDRVEVAYFT